MRPTDLRKQGYRIVPPGCANIYNTPSPQKKHAVGPDPFEHTQLMTSFSSFIRGAAISGFIGVAAGAFGAHGLQKHVDPTLLPVWHTAVLYQMIHTLAILILVGLAAHVNERALRWTGRLFAAGIVIFSGSLYVLVLTNVKWLGAITPIGGLCFLAGWLCLALSACASRTK